jgi:hypothetical protein
MQSFEITFWTAWDGETLVAIVALKRLSDDHGEVKSMPSKLRKGKAQAAPCCGILFRLHGGVEFRV